MSDWVQMAQMVANYKRQMEELQRLRGMKPRAGLGDLPLAEIRVSRAETDIDAAQLEIKERVNAAREAAAPTWNCPLYQRERPSDTRSCPCLTEET